MKIKTLKQKYLAALERKGETKVKDTARYTVMTRATGGFYYIGSAGGLRAGRTRSDSRPCSIAFKQKLIAFLGEGQ